MSAVAARRAHLSADPTTAAGQLLEHGPEFARRWLGDVAGELELVVDPDAVPVDVTIGLSAVPQLAERLNRLPIISAERAEIIAQIEAATVAAVTVLTRRP